MTATLRYDFEMDQWIATADWNSSVQSMGDTPQEAVEQLRFQCNKHNLWPY